MNDVITVEWTAGERTVPYVGHFENGKEYTLPEEQAQSFINEGSAKLVKRARSTTPKEERTSARFC